MLGLFASVKVLVKLDSVHVDNFVFRLHYKATGIILIVFSLLVTARQYIGDPIDCLVNSDVPPNIMDTYCWIHSTFTLPDNASGKKTLYPGVREYKNGDQVKYHKYYQWVCFVLFFQSIMFYVPRYLWKMWEAGKMKMLILHLNCPIIAQETKDERKKLLVDYFITNLHNQNGYAFRFFFCEMINFINVILQMYFVDHFLGGEFTTYGSAVIGMTELDPENRIDPMSLIFPKVTKCTFYKYETTGQQGKRDGLCVLPINIINEKIYVFLWFWFIVVAVLSGLALLYRLIVICIFPFRCYMLAFRSRLTLYYEIQTVCRQLQIGDWFVLYLLSKNIDPVVFKELVSELTHHFESDGNKEVDVSGL